MILADPKDLSELDPATAKVGDQFRSEIKGVDSAVVLLVDNGITFQLGPFTEILFAINQPDHIAPVMVITKMDGQQISFSAGELKVAMAQRAVARVRMDENAVVVLANNLRAYVREKLPHRQGELLLP